MCPCVHVVCVFSVDSMLMRLCVCVSVCLKADREVAAFPSSFLCAGIAIGGDTFPGSTLCDHCLRFQQIDEVRPLGVLPQSLIVPVL